MRILLTACLTLPLLAAPSLAGKAENCAAFGGIAMKAVTLRQDAGQDEASAAATIQREATGAERKFLAEVPLLVNWIYALPEDQLTPAIGDAVESQCMAAG